MTPEQFRQLFRFVFDKKHNFLYIDREQKIIAKNFNKLRLRLPGE